MGIANVSIKRPILISCIVLLMVATGLMSLGRLNVDLFPPVDFPVITVTTIYPGSTPEEIEKLVSKPLEEQISVISGLKKLTSHNMDGVSVIAAEFTLETDVRYAEEKMREKVMLARNNLPADLPEEPVVKQFDFITNVPVVTLALTADLPPGELYDLARERIKPLLERGEGIGEVRIIGGTRREIQVELDMHRLRDYEVSALEVAGQIKSAGVNVPVGKFDKGTTATLYRTIGEFRNIDQIRDTVITFSGDVSSAVTLGRLGAVRDGTADAKTISSLYISADRMKTGDGVRSKPQGRGERLHRPCLLIDVYKQSGTNTVAIADGIKKRMGEVNRVIAESSGNPRLNYIYDSAGDIRASIRDVRETMLMGIILAIVVVYLFLGNVRSTIITGIAIPNSLLGAFVMMYFMGFSINLMTLMALSLTVGLLIDDAIVVRENIFRKIESGMGAKEAAIEGTKEVMLAVIATTLTVMAVFLPIGFLQGMVGRFFRQFGLTVLFAMGVSLFDALTVAPMLSAYYAGKGEKGRNAVIRQFERFQGWLDRAYGKVLSFSLARPVPVIVAAVVVMLVSAASFVAVKKTFMSMSGENQYLINLEMPPETNLQTTYALADEIGGRIDRIPDVDYISVQAGSDEGEQNTASLGVFFVPAKRRSKSPEALKDEIRAIIASYPAVKGSIDYFTRVGGGQDRPFILQLRGDDLDGLLAYSEKLVAGLKKLPDLTDVMSSHRGGKPEYRIVLDENRMKYLGVTNKMVGMELRSRIEGDVVGTFRDRGYEYNVRMRLMPGQRDLKQYFNEIRVPNIHNKLVPLPALGRGEDGTAPAKILRQNRTRIVQITANLTRDGAVGSAIEGARKMMKDELPLPRGVNYSFEGDASMFEETVDNMVLAFILSILFIYLVLASLYESFITPFTIFLALPPAISGAFLALFITGKQLDLMGMIGIIMLLGLVTKNSILLVDFAVERVRAGVDRKTAMLEAGRLRLRPILMTTFAMIAGTLPLALGIGEAAKYRAGMSVAIVGGITVSTFITLVVVPAMFEYIDTFRVFVERIFGGETEEAEALPAAGIEEPACVRPVPAEALQVAEVKGKKRVPRAGK